MAINIRQKGAEGERQVIKILQECLENVMYELGHTPEDIVGAGKTFQRNQNQSAVGGNDLTNTFGLSIEVKRQEQLAINTWWKQCEIAAQRTNEHTVLIYRQNGKKWRVVTLANIPLPNGGHLVGRVEFDDETFRTWAKAWIKTQLTNGWKIQS